MRIWLAAALLVASASVGAVPPPPPPTEVLATQRAFFGELPQSMPGKHSAALKAMIAEDLVVTNEGEPMFDSREAWLAWREGLVGGRVEKFQMLREKFWRDRQDRVVVEEFWFPYAKDIHWHPDHPHRLVAYTFEGGLLTRVDYLIALDSVAYLDPKSGR